jgi:hypothetical protein
MMTDTKNLDHKLYYTKKQIIYEIIYADIMMTLLNINF